MPYLEEGVQIVYVGNRSPLANAAAIFERGAVAVERHIDSVAAAAVRAHIVDVRLLVRREEATLVVPMQRHVHHRRVLSTTLVQCALTC